MYGPTNPIFTAGNAYLVVTNVAGHSSGANLNGVPLGTTDGSATGEIGAKVLVIGTTGGSGTTAATPYQATKTVAATGTPEALAATSMLVDSVVLDARKARGTLNTSTCFIGFTNVNDAQLYPLAPGERLSLSAPPGKRIDLAGIYVDVGTNGDGITYTALA